MADADSVPVEETAPGSVLGAGEARAFQVAGGARTGYQLDDAYFAATGPLALGGVSAQEVAALMNRVREPARFPDRAVWAGDLAAAALIQEILRYVIARQAAAGDGRALPEAAADLQEHLAGEADRLLRSFAAGFPPTPVFRAERTAEEYLAGATGGVPNAVLALEELIMLRLANENPAFERLRDLHDDAPLEQGTAYAAAIAALESFFAGLPGAASGGASLFDVLRAPMRSSPTSLLGQLEYIRANWAGLLGDRFAGLLTRILRTLDLLAEERAFRAVGPPGPPPVPDAASLAGPGEYERFSEDRSWMPRLVMVAKSTYVWLDQLSRRYGRPVDRLDQIPNEELEALAAAGFTGLWLIGVWERSQASRRLKNLRGNPEAVASAYALYDYVVAADLGGPEALEDLRRRAWARGLRLASDMVPNHVGIDGRWVIEHPDWFLSLPQAPYPGYSYTGPDLSSDPRVGIQIEDHYWDGTDAAVVFRRRDRHTGEERFIYHGNDGTSMPWNDTAQLNYLLPEVREAVIRTILHVARQFPIIRFDAAMTLARQHVQRLWFPAPGTGGAIPSRSAHGLTDEEFARQMPDEFWREVVDRVAAEAPDTLLLAEAFWMLEGYFVRTLGMHRVYNSAFMHMTSQERNADYRRLMRNVLEFDPEILKRFVNFMNNPDEETAAAQFGTGDKYIGVCTMMATLPGLPMFGHGQVEGFRERYGMEYRRARWDEPVDRGLVERHRREIFPLLHRRRQFAEAAEFLLYEAADHGAVAESIFAYSNRVEGQASLVVYNNGYEAASGWVHRSVPYLDKKVGGLRTRHLGEGLGLRGGHDDFVVFREHPERARVPAAQPGPVRAGAVRVAQRLREPGPPRLRRSGRPDRRLRRPGASPAGRVDPLGGGRHRGTAHRAAAGRPGGPAGGVPPGARRPGRGRRPGGRGRPGSLAGRGGAGGPPHRPAPGVHPVPHRTGHTGPGGRRPRRAAARLGPGLAGGVGGDPPVPRGPQRPAAGIRGAGGGGGLVAGHPPGGAACRRRPGLGPQPRLGGRPAAPHGDPAGRCRGRRPAAGPRPRRGDLVRPRRLPLAGPRPGGRGPVRLEEQGDPGPGRRVGGRPGPGRGPLRLQGGPAAGEGGSGRVDGQRQRARRRSIISA